jgi:hypothetical protein
VPVVWPRKERSGSFGNGMKGSIPEAAVTVLNGEKSNIELWEETAIDVSDAGTKGDFQDGNEGSHSNGLVPTSDCTFIISSR